MPTMTRCEDGFGVESGMGIQSITARFRRRFYQARALLGGSACRAKQGEGKTLAAQVVINALQNQLAAPAFGLRDELGTAQPARANNAFIQRQAWGVGQRGGSEKQAPRGQ